jgi:hypothetical protein
MESTNQLLKKSAFRGTLKTAFELPLKSIVPLADDIFYGLFSNKKPDPVNNNNKQPNPIVPPVA